MTKIALVHFQPLEFFPPALNFLRHLAEQRDVSISMFTTRSSTQTYHVNVPKAVDLIVTRWPGSLGRSRILRAIKYLQFNAVTFIRLLVRRPSVIVYFDPYSAIPGVLLHLLTNRKCKLWIHYHEYFQPNWYAQGMLMTRIAHFLEKRYVFRTVLGISHTNEGRVRFFLSDHPNVDEDKVHAYPNYPPSEWRSFQRRIGSHATPVKLLALGSFTLRGTYLEEVCRWVQGRNGEVELDIYSLYFDKETQSFLENMDPRWIRFHPDGLPYDEIPRRIQESGFDIGLVLYKCRSLNAIHCVSNKVFEYLLCGLDVWFPPEMKGTEVLVTKGIYPKVLPVDFRKLDGLDLTSLLSREGQSYVPRDFACESVYDDWIARLIG